MSAMSAFLLLRLQRHMEKHKATTVKCKVINLLISMYSLGSTAKQELM